MRKLKTDSTIKLIQSTIDIINSDLQDIKNPQIGLHDKKQRINRIRFLMKSLVTDVVDLSNMKFL